MIDQGEPLTDALQARWLMDGPDCDECLGNEEGDPILYPGNIDAWKVYQATGNQLIVAPMGGLIAINQLAVWEYLDRHEGEFTKSKNEIFDQVCIMAQKIIQDQNEKAKIKEDTEGW